MAVRVSSSSTGSFSSTVVCGVEGVEGVVGVDGVDGVCEEGVGSALPLQLIPERDNTNEIITNKKKCFNLISPP